MLNKVTDALLHMIPAGMLLIAIGRWPYGYYMLLRVVILASALLLAGLIYQQAKTFTLWVGPFVVRFVWVGMPTEIKTSQINLIRTVP